MVVDLGLRCPSACLLCHFVRFPVLCTDLCETDRQSPEHPVDFDAFAGREVVVNVLVQAFEAPYRVLLAVCIRRFFALNKLATDVSHKICKKNLLPKVLLLHCSAMLKSKLRV